MAFTILIAHLVTVAQPHKQSRTQLIGSLTAEQHLLSTLEDRLTKSRRHHLKLTRDIDRIKKAIATEKEKPIEDEQ